MEFYTRVNRTVRIILTFIKNRTNWNKNKMHVVINVEIHEINVIKLQTLKKNCLVQNKYQGCDFPFQCHHGFHKNMILMKIHMVLYEHFNDPLIISCNLFND